MPLTDTRPAPVLSAQQAARVIQRGLELELEPDSDQVQFSELQAMADRAGIGAANLLRALREETEVGRDEREDGRERGTLPIRILRSAGVGALLGVTALAGLPMASFALALGLVASVYFLVDGRATEVRWEYLLHNTLFWVMLLVFAQGPGPSGFVAALLGLAVTSVLALMIPRAGEPDPRLLRSPVL